MQEALLTQLKTEIEDALTESEHVYRLTIDYQILDQKISAILVIAKKNGVDEKLIWNLIHSRIPSYVNYLNCKVSEKKAA